MPKQYKKPPPSLLSALQAVNPALRRRGTLRADLTPAQYAEFVIYMLTMAPGFYAPPPRRPKNPFARKKR